MELLVLGGTSFAGRHVVEAALAAGHGVTTFNRGRTNPGLFPDVRALHGDRASGDYAALHGAGPFDAVVDMCAYVPRAVREAIGALGADGLNGPYILISSVSAYGEPQAPVDVEGFTEESPLAALPDAIDAALLLASSVDRAGRPRHEPAPGPLRSRVTVDEAPELPAVARHDQVGQLVHDDVVEHPGRLRQQLRRDPDAAVDRRA